MKIYINIPFEHVSNIGGDGDEFSVRVVFLWKCELFWCSELWVKIMSKFEVGLKVENN